MFQALLSYDEKDALARKIRAQLVEVSHRKKTPHLASSLSCVDILVSLYFQIANISKENLHNSCRDRVILSKGHAATALYVTLCEKGVLSKTLLDGYATSGSLLGEHPGPNSVPGIEWATGSLGHGLGVGLGMALAAKIQKRDYSVYCILSDGECNEGSTWEAALIAPAKKVNNLTVLVDFNKWQATGRSRDVTALEPLVDKWRTFGWNAVEVDGHSCKCIEDGIWNSAQDYDKPTAIICHTVKGKGVSFMEDDNNWHYRIPTEEEVFLSKKELGVA